MSERKAQWQWMHPFSTSGGSECWVQQPPPPDEPHPDQLKRCEVCQWCFRDCDDNTCTHPDMIDEQQKLEYTFAEEEQIAPEKIDFVILDGTVSCRHWVWDGIPLDKRHGINGEVLL